jgi:hypothetical protein
VRTKIPARKTKSYKQETDGSTNEILKWTQQTKRQAEKRSFGLKITQRTAQRISNPDIPKTAWHIGDVKKWFFHWSANKIIIET